MRVSILFFRREIYCYSIWSSKFLDRVPNVYLNIGMFLSPSQYPLGFKWSILAFFPNPDEVELIVMDNHVYMNGYNGSFFLLYTFHFLYLLF